MKDVGRFRITPERRVTTKSLPTKVPALYHDMADYERLRDVRTKELRHLQTRLYAHDRYALLVIFQAMDAAGKDSAIKHVMNGVDPQGCQVYSFKPPSTEELDHDFLWRAVKALPERGRIGLFNRSYYEETLVVRVHDHLLDAEKLPTEIRRSKSLWTERFESINAFEKHLHRNGTRIVKFFLHLSKEEQRKRFIERIDDPEKHWKFAAGDVEERKHWREYQRAYGEMLSATSTAHAPWFAIPADDKKNARLLMSEVLISTLKGMKLSYPPPGETPAALRKLRKQLIRE